MNGDSSYTPCKGDIVTINFNPSAGNEIQKRRPALVISNSRYAQLTGLALVCPITHANNNRLKDSGLFIPINTEKIEGVINPLQFHTFDYQQRQMRYLEKVDNQILRRALTTINDIVNAKEF